MLRAIKYIIILGILGGIGLFGYSFLLEPEPGRVTHTLEIDAQ